MAQCCPDPQFLSWQILRLPATHASRACLHSRVCCRTMQAAAPHHISHLWPADRLHLRNAALPHRPLRFVCCSAAAVARRRRHDRAGGRAPPRRQCARKAVLPCEPMADICRQHGMNGATSSQRRLSSWPCRWHKVSSCVGKAAHRGERTRCRGCGGRSRRLLRVRPPQREHLKVATRWRAAAGTPADYQVVLVVSCRTEQRMTKQ